MLDLVLERVVWCAVRIALACVVLALCLGGVVWAARFAIWAVGGGW
jgi:hypothetical protein